MALLSLFYTQIGLSNASKKEAPYCKLEQLPPIATLKAQIPKAHHKNRQIEILSSFAAELDAKSPTEFVIAGTIKPDEKKLGKPWTFYIWIFRPTSSKKNYKLISHYPITSSDAWDGTIDAEPQLKLVKPVNLLKPCHQLIRVEYTDVQGSVDPRYFYRYLNLLQLQADKLKLVFAHELKGYTERGPSRTEVRSVANTIIFNTKKFPATLIIRLKDKKRKIAHYRGGKYVFR